jgi:hypothetical protein
MTQNPFLQVFVANGYYDLATPFFATEYTVNHLGLEPALRANLRMTYYAAGHMMYVHAAVAGAVAHRHGGVPADRRRAGVKPLSLCGRFSCGMTPHFGKRSSFA